MPGEVEGPVKVPQEEPVQVSWEEPELVATTPQGSATVAQDDSAPSEGVIQAFPVQKALPNSGLPDRHANIAWRVVQDLQSKVAQHGLGSPEVMQVIRVMNTELLSPFDIKHLAQVLFQPAIYSF